MRGGVPVRPWLSCAAGVISADGWAACGVRGVVGTEEATARLWEASAGEAASISASTESGGIESSKTERGERGGGKFVIFALVGR